MGAHHPNPRLAKIHRNYSVEDTARLFNVHKNTVRNWLKDGLEPIDDQRPTLVRGEELRRFLNDRRAREAGLWSRPHLLSAVPRAEGAGREHGRMHYGRRHHRHAPGHLP
jgi:hypothetical protein